MGERNAFPSSTTDQASIGTYPVKVNPAMASDDATANAAAENAMSPHPIPCWRNRKDASPSLIMNVERLAACAVALPHTTATAAPKKKTRGKNTAIAVSIGIFSRVVEALNATAETAGAKFKRTGGSGLLVMHIEARIAARPSAAH